jgi:molybdate transport system ATP-binding protein
MLLASLDTYLNTFHLELTFSAEVGKTTVLLGESGAGKSTVLRNTRRPIVSVPSSGS